MSLLLTRLAVPSAALFCTLTLMAPTRGLAADATPEVVLPKLHESNHKEIEMGKLAQKNGQSKETKSFGAMLVKDHSDADKKVKALAKKEKVDLDGAMPAMGDMPASGSDFDQKFAAAMLEDHKKDIAEATEARDSTTDPKLKSLLTAMLPTLQKHEDTAQKIADQKK